MTALVNIIHPDTYKTIQKDGKLHLVIDEEESLEERNEKIIRFVDYSLKNNSRVFVYQMFSDSILEMGQKSMALEIDKTLCRLLEDERIERFATLNGGIPLQDEKPDYVSQDVWNYIRKYVITDSELKTLVEKPRQTFFIGGFLEFCLLNFAHNYATRISNGEGMYAIPELCMQIKENEAEKATSIMESVGIKSIGYEKAMKLVVQI